MSFNYLFGEQASSSVPSVIPVTQLYLSSLFEHGHQGILITSVEGGFAHEERIPLQLKLPDNFGPLKLSLQSLRLHGYFRHYTTIKVSEILLKRSSDIYRDIHDGDWEITHINTANLSSCRFLVERAVSENFTVILAITFEVIDRYNRTRQLVMHPYSDGTPLHRAVKENDIDVVATLIDYKLDVNANNNDGWTPLHLAVDLEMLNIVDLLINNGANVNAKTDQYQVPLHFAAKKNNSNLLISLRKNQAKLDETDLFNQTPLFYAVVAGNVNIVDTLLRVGANAQLEDSYNHTPFYLAVQQKNLDLIEVFLEKNIVAEIQNSIFYLSEESSTVVSKEEYIKIINVLLKKGAKINSQGIYSRSPLQHAVINNNIECVQALLACKANIKVLSCSRENLLHLACRYDANKCIQFLLDSNIDINAVNLDQKTALQVAVESINVYAIELILKKDPHIHLPGDLFKTIVNLVIEAKNFPVIEFLLKDRPEGTSKINFQIALYSAVKSGCPTIVQLFIENGADVNLKDKSGNTALHLAVESQCFEMIEFILNNKVDVNVQNASGKTALHLAIESAPFDIIELLLKHKADVNVQDASGTTALHSAIKSGYLDVFNLLIENGADLNLKDGSGKTALNFAIEGNCLDIIQSILINKVNVNSKDASGKTALHFAVQFNQLPIAEFLLNNDIDVDIQDESGKTALHMAFNLHALDMVELLLKYEANVNLKDELGKTALHLASEKPNMTVEIFTFILISTIDVDTRDILGRTALHYAVLGGNISTLECLLEARADINVEDFEGKSPVHLTMAWENEYTPYFSCTKVLINHRANVNAVDHNFTCLLHLACFNKNAELVEYLIRNGADASIKDKHGRTVLHYLCMTKLNQIPLRVNNTVEDFKNTLNVLLDEDVSVNDVDECGKTPLHYAVEDNSLFMCESLLKIGANINIVDKNGNTPIDNLISRTRCSFRSDLGDGIITLFIRQIIKMKALELDVRSSFLSIIYKMDNKERFKFIKCFEHDCHKEIGLMQITKFVQNNVTYYDFLSEKPCNVVAFTLNRSIVEAIQSSELETKFPIYCYFLRAHLREAQRQIKLL